MRTIESKPNMTHETVLEWCHQSALTMMKAMKPRNQKTFVRKLSDQAKFQGDLAQDLSELKVDKVQEWEALKTTSDEFAKLQSGVDQTLEKIRKKLVAKNCDAEKLLNKYKAMLSERQNTRCEPF